MKVGDLVQQGDDVIKFKGENAPEKSKRVGVVIEAPGLGVNEYYDWLVLFDCGEWEIYEGDMDRGYAEVVSEHR